MVTFDNLYSVFDLVSAPVFVLEMTEDGEPVYAAFNSHARKTSGRPLSDYLGNTAREVYPQAYGRTAYERHCEVRDSGTPMTYQIDLPIGGITRSIRTTLRPDFDAAGKVTRLVGSSVDISAEKYAQEAKVQFDTLTAEMEQFVALAAHDLRAPMRNIATITEMLRDGFIDQGDGKLELLEILDNIATKTMDLVTDILEHVEIAAVDHPDSVFSFPALCYDICDTIDPAKKHNITTSTATLNSDRTAMQIALRNMIDNAIKHGRRESLNINIDVREGMPGMLEVTITDDGKGFSSDALKIMNKSQFRDQSGYGLFAVKRLISARKGTVQAQNLPDDAGAVVRFSLPGIWINGSASVGDKAPELPATENILDQDRRHSA